MGGARDDRRARAAVARESLGPRHRDVHDVVGDHAECGAFARDGRERGVERLEIGHVPRDAHVRRGAPAEMPQHPRGGPHGADVARVQAVVRQRVVGPAPPPGPDAVAHLGVIGEAVDGHRDEEHQAQRAEQGPEVLDRPFRLGASLVAPGPFHDGILANQGLELLVRDPAVDGAGAAGSHRRGGVHQPRRSTAVRARGVELFYS